MHKSILAAAAALLLLPAAASAAVDKTLQPGGAPFTWTGAGNGLWPVTALDWVDDSRLYECTAAQECIERLLKVDATGDLRVELDGTETEIQSVDLNLYVFDSDPDGAANENLGGRAGATPYAEDETLFLQDLEPGYYLVRVLVYAGVQATFTAAATLTESVTAAEANP